MNSSLPRSPAGSVLAHGYKVGPGIARAPRYSGEVEAVRRFRAARHKLGLSQLEAAVFLGGGLTSVEDWERGAARLPAWALVELERRAA